MDENISMDEDVAMIYSFRLSVRSILSENIGMADVVKFVPENVFRCATKDGKENTCSIAKSGLIR